MNEENTKRRAMFALIGFNVAVMLSVFGFMLIRGKMGCLGFTVAFATACVAAGVGFVAAMMTES